MTSHHVFIDDLQKRGVQIVVAGQQLRCRGPRGALTAADLDRLRSCKREILAGLNKDESSGNILGSDPILESRHELGAVLIRSRRFSRDIWIALTDGVANELRIAESQRHEPRPVLLPADVTRLKNRPVEAIGAVLNTMAVFPRSELLQ